MIAEGGHVRHGRVVGDLGEQAALAEGESPFTLSALARRAKTAREKGDYEAAPPSSEEAAEFVAAEV